MDSSHRPRIWRPDPQPDAEPPFHAEKVARAKRSAYRNFDKASFQRKVDDFWQRRINEPGLDLLEAVNKVVTSRPGVQQVFPQIWDEIPAGTLLWRARAMSGEAVESARIAISDLWEPPKEFANAARFNAKNDPLLYATVGLPIDALDEARIVEPETPFILTGFEVMEPIRLSRVGLSVDLSLTPRQQEIEDMLNSFMAEVASLKPEVIGDHDYSRIQQVLRTFYPLEIGWESGWIYRSSLAGSREEGMLEPLNVAMLPRDARSRLAVWRVVLGNQHGWHEGKHHVELAGYSRRLVEEGGLLDIEWFYHSDFSSLQEYFDYLHPLVRDGGEAVSLPEPGAA